QSKGEKDREVEVFRIETRRVLDGVRIHGIHECRGQAQARIEHPATELVQQPTTKSSEQRLSYLNYDVVNPEHSEEQVQKNRISRRSFQSRGMIEELAVSVALNEILRDRVVTVGDLVFRRSVEHSASEAE